VARLAAEMTGERSRNGGTGATQRAALEYLRRGWSVIPIETCGKRPLIAWRGYQLRRATHDEVLAWFRRWPTANIAIVTGAVSGLVVLDLDPAHGGTESLHAVLRTHGGLQPTLSAVSGGGGRHLYFAHPGTPVRNRAGLRPGMDLRGDGGYIVAPPSRHVSGAGYRWQGGPGSRPPGRMPAWLLARRVARPMRTPADWQRLLCSGVEEGRRNNAIASLAGHLLRRGVDPDVALELLLGWNAARCRPPLPLDEVARTVASIQRTRERQRSLLA
jgi:hypothetical protein